MSGASAGEPEACVCGRGGEGTVGNMMHVVLSFELLARWVQARVETLNELQAPHISVSVSACADFCVWTCVCACV
jgi:hypothetical protein